MLYSCIHMTTVDVIGLRHAIPPLSRPRPQYWGVTAPHSMSPEVFTCTPIFSILATPLIVDYLVCATEGGFCRVMVMHRTECAAARCLCSSVSLSVCLSVCLSVALVFITLVVITNFWLWTMYEIHWRHRLHWRCYCNVADFFTNMILVFVVVFF